MIKSVRYCVNLTPARSRSTDGLSSVDVQLGSINATHGDARRSDKQAVTRPTCEVASTLDETVVLALRRLEVDAEPQTVRKVHMTHVPDHACQ